MPSQGDFTLEEAQEVTTISILCYGVDGIRGMGALWLLEVAGTVWKDKAHGWINIGFLRLTQIETLHNVGTLPNELYEIGML